MKWVAYGCAALLTEPQLRKQLINRFVWKRLRHSMVMRPEGLHAEAERRPWTATEVSPSNFDAKVARVREQYSKVFKPKEVKRMKKTGKKSGKKRC